MWPNKNLFFSFFRVVHFFLNKWEANNPTDLTFVDILLKVGEFVVLANLVTKSSISWASLHFFENFEICFEILMIIWRCHWKACKKWERKTPHINTVVPWITWIPITWFSITWKYFQSHGAFYNVILQYKKHHVLEVFWDRKHFYYCLL